MTPARRAELIAGVEAALALEGGVLTGREHIEALLLWFATSPSGLTVMDAVVAGYRVNASPGEEGQALDEYWYLTPPGGRRIWARHYPTQADAWRAALRHMADAG